MPNKITPFQGSDQIPPNFVFFVKVNYFYVPFFNPSRDTVLAAVPQTDETVVQILDIQFDSNNNALCKCSINPVVDSLTVDQADQYIMNVFLYISENVTRLWGLNISQTFFTDDDNFPDSGSTLIPSLGSGTPVNPSNSDLGNQATQTISDVKDQISQAVKSLNGPIVWIVVILIIIVVGLYAFAKVEKEA